MAHDRPPAARPATLPPRPVLRIEGPDWVLVPLRAFLGFTFCFAGLQKLANPAFFRASNPASIQAQMAGAARHSPLHGVLTGLGHVAVLVGLVIALAELAVGLGTLFGLKGGLAAGLGVIGLVGGGMAAAIGRLVGGTSTSGPVGTLNAGAAPPAPTTTTDPPAGPATPSTTAPPTTAPPTRPAGTRLGPASAVPVGGAAAFTDPGSGDPALVVQPEQGTFLAFDAVCPHAGCTVQYSHGDGLFICPCHGSEFNGHTGAVEVGPAQSGLTRITVAEGSDGQLYAR